MVVDINKSKNLEYEQRWIGLILKVKCLSYCNYGVLIVKVGLEVSVGVCVLL